LSIITLMRDVFVTIRQTNRLFVTS